MKLLNSLKGAQKYMLPWEHFTFSNPLDELQIQEVIEACWSKDGYINDGTRAGGEKNNKFREYVTLENIKKYKHLKRLIDDLISEPVREQIACLVNNKDNFYNSYVRLEVLDDKKNFWLAPHVDIPEKLISCLIFINSDNEDENLGTDLYNPGLKVIKTVPYKNNFGFLFAGFDTWHGLEKGKKIKKSRKGLQLNYVTFKTDWPVN